MRNSFSLLFVLFLSFSTLNAADLNWEHNYDNALKKAAKDKKMVYLFIAADNCRYCERFAKQTLSNTELIKTMKEEYVLLFMSRDQHKIPDKFEIYGAPIHYFLTHKGEIITKAQGSREIEGWYDILDEVDLLRDNFTTHL